MAGMMRTSQWGCPGERCRRRPHAAPDLAEVEVVRVAARRAPVEPLLECAQTPHRTEDLLHRRHGRIGHGRVRPLAARDEPRPDHADAVGVELEVGRLPDQRRVGVVAGAQHGAHAVPAALLLDHRREEEVAARRPHDLEERLDPDEIGGDSGLHV